MAYFDISTLFTTQTNVAAQSSALNFKSAERVHAFNYQNFEPYTDSFSSNPLYSILNKSNAEIAQIAKSNPKLMSLLKEYNIPLNPNMKVIEDMT